MSSISPAHSSRKKKLIFFYSTESGVAANVSQDQKLVGEPDGRGFGVGLASGTLKPNATVLMTSRGKPKSRRGKDVGETGEQKRMDTQGHEGELRSTGTAGTRGGTQQCPGPRPSTPPSKSEAFIEFKQERGSEISRIFNENKGIIVYCLFQKIYYVKLSSD